jgi:hypothetical protein
MSASLGADAGGGGDRSNASTMAGASGGGTPRTINRGDFHCYNCRATDHWAYKCPQLSGEQQQQLNMNLKVQDENEETQEEAHQLLNVTFVQGGALPDNWVYLDGCLTVTVLRTDKYLKGIKTLPNGIRIYCNAGAVQPTTWEATGGSKYGTSPRLFWEHILNAQV